MVDDRSNAVLRWWRRALITVTAAGAALASFVFLRDLALHVGWPYWAAVLLPLTIDALAAAALTEYRLTGSRTAVVVAVLAIVGSATGNGLSHLYSVGLMEPGWIAVTAVGAVPAVTVGLVVHLFTARGSSWNRSVPPNQHPDTAEETAPGGSVSASSSATPHETARPVSSAATAAVHPTTSTSPSSSKPSKHSKSPTLTVTELASQISSNGWHSRSGDDLASLLRVSKGRALQARKLAQAEFSRPHPNGQPSNPDLIGTQA